MYDIEKTLGRRGYHPLGIPKVNNDYDLLTRANVGYRMWTHAVSRKCVRNSGLECNLFAPQNFREVFVKHGTSR